MRSAVRSGPPFVAFAQDEDDMEGLDPRTSFGYEESKRYDAVDTRGDEAETVAFLAQLVGERDALEFASALAASPYRSRQLACA